MCRGPAMASQFDRRSRTAACCSRHEILRAFVEAYRRMWCGTRVWIVVRSHFFRRSEPPELRAAHEWHQLAKEGEAMLGERGWGLFRSWQVFELTWPGKPRSRHFAGDARWEGRVSSSIISFDPAIGRGVSSSGRVYQLTGVPGLGLDGEYVWNHWLAIHEQQDVVDITQHVRDEMVAAGAHIPPRRR